MARGTIVRIVRDRGFGFINSEGVDLFFHISSVRPSHGFSFHLLREGQTVDFDVASTDRGPRADNITDPDLAPVAISPTIDPDLSFVDSDARYPRRRNSARSSRR